MKEVFATQIEVLSQHLLSEHGAVVGYDELASILGTTAAALRLRQSRRHDLPPRIPGLASCRWAVPVVAAWLIRGEAQQTPASSARRPGRPRNQPRIGGL